MSYDNIFLKIHELRQQYFCNNFMQIDCACNIFYSNITIHFRQN